MSTIHFKFVGSTTFEQMANVQKITEELVLGEGPHWDHDQQALYFVSILEKTIHKYVPATGAYTKTTLGQSYFFNVVHFIVEYRAHFRNYFYPSLGEL